ncbi:MAG: AAA family ATPase [Acidobacteriota bacterium]
MNTYIKSIRLKNFQSHHDSSFELSPGLNIIVGPSDQGKSAVIRALRWVMYNEPRGAAFIRTGENRTEVQIVLSNGTVVERIRDDSGKVNRYILEISGEEPQVFERFNKEVPLEIRKALGISKLVVDRDRSLEINLARQLEGPFLMEESGATRSKVLGRVANLHIIDAAQRDVLRDVNMFSQEASRLDHEIKEIEEQLEAFVDLEAADTKLADVEKLMHRLAEKELILSQISDLNSIYRSTNAQMHDTMGRLSILDSVDNAGGLADKIKEYSAMLIEIESLAQGLVESQDSINKSLMIIRQTEKIPDVELVLEKLRSLREEGFVLQQASKTYQELSSEYQQKQKELAQAKMITEKVANIDETEAAKANITKHVEKLDKLTELKKTHDNASIKYQKAEDEYAKYDELILTLSVQYGDSLTEAGRCPVCFSEISPETVERIKKELA